MKAEEVLDFLNSAVGTAWIQFAMVVLVVAMANYIRSSVPTILAYVSPGIPAGEPMGPEPACQEIVLPPPPAREAWMSQEYPGWVPKRVEPHTQPASPIKGAEAEFYVVTGYAVGDGYTPGEITADGRKVRPGITVACPQELTLGTVVFIEGIGARVCEDRGSAIVGKRLDVAFWHPEDALEFGKQRLAVAVIR